MSTTDSTGMAGKLPMITGPNYSPAINDPTCYVLLYSVFIHTYSVISSPRLTILPVEILENQAGNQTTWSLVGVCRQQVGGVRRQILTIRAVPPRPSQLLAGDGIGKVLGKVGLQ